MLKGMCREATDFMVMQGTGVREGGDFAEKARHFSEDREIL